MKTTSAADGAALYGASFRNYDALVVKQDASEIEVFATEDEGI